MFINGLGLSTQAYGLGFGFVALGLIVGANATRRFGTRWDARRASRTGTLLPVTMAVLAGAGGRIFGLRNNYCSDADLDELTRLAKTVAAQKAFSS